MSRGQRFTFLAIAVVIAVVAIVVLADSSEDNGDGSQTSATTPTPTATPTGTPSPSEAEPANTPTPTATPAPPLLTGGKVTKLEAKEGDTVTFRVRSPEAIEVHVHGYDIKKELEPNQTATMSFKADIPGIFEIEFEQTAEQIGQLTVNP